MIDLNIQPDTEEVEAALGTLARKANAVMSRASNRTVGTVKKTMQKEASSRYRIKSGDVGRTIRTHRATVSRPYASIKSYGEHIGLEKFIVSPNRPVQVMKGNKRTPRVYKAAVRKSQSLVPLAGDRKPFVAIMKNGHQGVFRRKTGTETGKRRRFKLSTFNKRKKRKDNQITGVYGPSVPQMIKNTEVMQIINQNAAEMMQQRLKHEIDFELKKAKKL